MRVAMFYHSLVSDWNHGNAHFLRGVVAELMARAHKVVVYEPRDSWSRQNLLAEEGSAALEDFQQAFPHLRSETYDPETLDLDSALDSVDLVIAHEWNDPRFIARLGEHRAVNGGYKLLFHDTHHRAATQREQMSKYDLSHYDGLLAFGRVIREIYLDYGWAQRAWVWHEAVDHRVFQPIAGEKKDADVIWIGNWGDEERSLELFEYLITPVQRLKLRARVHGVRYPGHALQGLKRARIQFGGWLPNYKAPLAYARARLTVHVPRLPYARALPGIPTIRVFEALACGTPLVCAPWQDIEGLFAPGEDYLVARDSHDMERHIRAVLHDPALAKTLAQHGLQTVRARHTCAHRVDELLTICAELGVRIDAPELIT